MVASDTGMMDGRHTRLPAKAPSANKEVGRWQGWGRMCKSREGHSWGRGGAAWVEPQLLYQHNGAALTLPTGAVSFNRCCPTGGMWVQAPSPAPRGRAAAGASPGPTPIEISTLRCQESSADRVPPPPPPR